MPYLIRKRDQQWCVYKEDADGNPTDDALGCHESEDAAEAQRRALYASEDDKALADPAADEPFDDGFPPEPEVSEKRLIRPTQAEVNYVPLSAVDGKACANCRWFTKDESGYCHVVENYPQEIVPTGWCQRHEEASIEAVESTVGMRESALDLEDFDDGFGDNAETVEVAPLTETFVKELAELDGTAPELSADVEAAPSTATQDGPETAIQTMPTETDSEVVPEADTADAAAVSTDAPSLFKAIRERFRQFLGQTDDALATGLKIYGNHFLITWSNNFVDRDEEIFTAKAMDDYVTRVDAGIVPPPGVWVWHTGVKTRIGKADWVARHGHFIIAAGPFDDTPAAQRAKAYYARHARKTAVSHGFSYPPNAFDGRHYHRFNTFEISLLPRGKEANRFTSLEGIKAMAVSEEKLKYLKDVFGDQAEAILADLDKRGKALEDLGVEYKDFTAATDAEQPSVAVAEAVDAADSDLTALLAEVIRDNAQLATFMAAQTKAFNDYKATVEEREAARDKEIGALKDQLDSRPRSASKDEATELDAERLKAIEAQAAKQLKVTDPFTGLEIETGAA